MLFFPVLHDGVGWCIDTWCFNGHNPKLRKTIFMFTLFWFFFFFLSNFQLSQLSWRCFLSRPFRFCHDLCEPIISWPSTLKNCSFLCCRHAVFSAPGCCNPPPDFIRISRPVGPPSDSRVSTPSGGCSCVAIRPQCDIVILRGSSCQRLLTYLFSFSRCAHHIK